MNGVNLLNLVTCVCKGTYHKEREEGMVDSVSALLVNFFSPFAICTSFSCCCVVFSFIADMCFSSGCMHFLFTFFFSCLDSVLFFPPPHYSLF